MLTVALFALVAPSSAAEPAAFASIPGNPIGIACVSDGPGGKADRLIVTSYAPGGLHLVHEDGRVERLAPSGFPYTWSSIESYIALSHGLGDFPSGRLYATFGSRIYVFNEDLTEATLFAEVAGKPGTHAGITFDRTGLWDFDMIVSFHDGSVYRLDAAGKITYVNSTHQHHESPRVISDDPRWGDLAGCITTSSESAHKVFAFCPDGSVSTLASGITHAETSDVRPVDGETSFGDTGYVYFASRYSSGKIWGYPASAFPEGSQGDLFVSREFAGGITRISGVGQISEFESAQMQHYEGSNFCFRPTSIDVPDGGCVDKRAPEIACNAPTVIPPDSPIRINALVNDDCPGDVEIEVSDIACWRETGAGGTVSLVQSCKVAATSQGVLISHTGGVGAHIGWTITATDAAGRSHSQSCEVEVQNPSSEASDGTRGTSR